MSYTPKTTWIAGMQPIYLGTTGDRDLDTLVQFVRENPRTCAIESANRLARHVSTVRKQYIKLLKKNLVRNVQDPRRQVPQLPAIYEVIQ